MSEEVKDDIVLDGDGLTQEDDEILKLLNGDPKGGEEDDDDDLGEELEPQDGDSPEVLRTKLAAKNKIIRQREKAIKRMQKEMEASKGTALTAEDVAKLLQGNQAKDDRAPEITIEDLKERFDEDPSSIIDLMLQREQALEQKLANVLKQRDAYYAKKFSPDGGEIPAEVSGLVERLRARPEYSEFSDEQLLTVAKTLKPIKSRISRVPATTSSGNLPMTASGADVEKVSKSALEAMGYTDED